MLFVLFTVRKTLMIQKGLTSIFQALQEINKELQVVISITSQN